jgi:hypothetical protein
MCGETEKIQTDVNGVARREDIYVLGGLMPRETFQTLCEFGDWLKCFNSRLYINTAM